MAKTAYRRAGSFGQRTIFAQTNFELGLDEFLNKVLPAKQVVFVRKISMEVLRRLIDKSPVDTGRFRGNWYVSLDAPDRTASEKTDKSGSATKKRGAQVIKALQAGQKVIISNNLPYAVMLEYGWSNQAPHGMVAVTLEEVRALHG